MKIKSLPTLLLAIFPGFAFADLVDFGATTNANKGGGFVVTGVFDGTPAATLGLVEGDLVTGLDGHKLSATTSLARLIAGVREADSEVSVDWMRGDKPMAGKATLDKALDDKAFAERYPDKAVIKKLSPEEQMEMLLSEDIADVEIDPMDDLKALGVDVSGLQKQIEKALEDSALSGLFGGASTGFSMSTSMTSLGGHTVTVKGAGGDKKHVTITSKDGEKIFDEKITKDELDKVPEEHRERVRGMLGSNLSVIIRDATMGSGSIGGIGEPSEVEDSAADLLKKLEQEQAEEKDK